MSLSCLVSPSIVGIVPTLLCVLLACGGPSPESLPIDARADDTDAPVTHPDGATWRSISAPITGFYLDDPMPLNEARSVRIMVQTTLSGCETRGLPMVGVVLDEPDIVVDIRVWQLVGADCPAVVQDIVRPLLLPALSGTWTVHAGGLNNTAEPLVLDIGPAPMRACDPSLTFGCEMDCDCGAGELCLGADGLGGPFSQCARPCELDRECGGNSRCVHLEDGLSFQCDDTLPECDNDVRCAAGYTCQGGTCVMEPILGGATRIACTDDADCTAPLRCVQSLFADGQARCERICPTNDSPAWCSAGHFCGNFPQDVAGLAEQNGICVWAGE